MRMVPRREPSRPAHGVRGRLAALLGAALLAIALGISGGAIAASAAAVEVTAEPASIAVGETSTVTATGLGGLETAFFGLAPTPDGGSFTESGDVQYDAPVSNGNATATFTADQAGSFTVAVGNGETPLGTVIITVTESDQSGGTTLAADSSTIATGETTTVTATGLGGLETASFGLGGTPGGSFSPSGATAVTSPVTDGTATAVFTASEAGSFTIAVGDGENVLATTIVTVTAAATPTPTPTPTATPVPANTDDGVPTWVFWLIVGIAVAVTAIVTTLIVNRRNARKDDEAPSPEGEPTASAPEVPDGP